MYTCMYTVYYTLYDIVYHTQLLFSYTGTESKVKMAEHNMFKSTADQRSTTTSAQKRRRDKENLVGPQAKRPRNQTKTPGVPVDTAAKKYNYKEVHVHVSFPVFFHKILLFSFSYYTARR